MSQQVKIAALQFSAFASYAEKIRVSNRAAMNVSEIEAPLTFLDSLQSKGKNLSVTDSAYLYTEKVNKCGESLIVM